MKKILSLTLAAIMVASAIPTAFAVETHLPGGSGTTIPTVGNTTVTLVGTEEDKGSYYEVEVPATMTPGQTAPVSVEGTWKGSETLKVTAPEKVTLYYGDQSIDVAVDFAGINAAGNDLADCAASANLKLADASVKFGTWTGVIEYNVELVNGTTPDHGDYPYQPNSCPATLLDENGDGRCDYCGNTPHPAHGGVND